MIELLILLSLMLFSSKWFAGISDEDVDDFILVDEIDD
jgi:hypothetical protein